MTALTINIELYGLDAGQMPVNTEILDSDLEVRQRMVVRGHKTTELGEGTYLVRATLPSGDTLSAPVVITAGQLSAEVLLHTQPTPHEYLALQSVLGGYHGRAQTYDAAPIKSARPGAPLAPEDEAVWLRMWRLESWRRGGDSSGFAYENAGAWQVEPLNAWQPQYYPDPAMPEVRVLWMDPPDRTPRIRCLQVGGEGIPWRSICLPPSPDRLQVLMRPSGAGGELSGGLAVKVVTVDNETEALSHYALSGDFNAAEGLADSVMDKAEDLFREKMIYPYGAMVGAYHLLLSGKLERLHNWANNFASWVDWLPDSAVIHAWQILYGGSGEGHSVARQRLLQAAQRGLPVMRKGLRLLVDGLSIFADLARQEGRRDDEVEQALSYVRRYASSTDWNQRLTTFYGETPAKPSLKPVRGEAPEAITNPAALMKLSVRM